MSGSLSGIPLSQQFDGNGRLLIGALLYTFAANTTNPQTMFQDAALTIPHVYPLPTDSNGRIPMFYLADGSVHVRLTDASGVQLYDNLSVLVIGPSSGAAPAGGVDPNAILSTGDYKWRPTSESLAGWVPSNSKTIGSAISGATGRANADTAALFTWLWTNFSDALCPVSGGRGGSAAADFAANKTIATFDMRGLGPIGTADMGAADSGRLDGGLFPVGDKLTVASRGGAPTNTLDATMIPIHQHAAGTLVYNNTVPNTGWGNGSVPISPTHGVNAGTLVVGRGLAETGETLESINESTQGVSLTGPTAGVAGQTGNAGSGAAHNNLSNCATGYWYVRL